MLFKVAFSASSKTCFFYIIWIFWLQIFDGFGVESSCQASLIAEAIRHVFIPFPF